MPQVFIDSTATPDQLRLTARFLQDLAALAEGETVSGGIAPTAIVEPVRVAGAMPELAAPFGGPSLDPAVVFAQTGTAVIPVVPTGTPAHRSLGDATREELGLPPVVIPPPPPMDAVLAPVAAFAAANVQLDRDGFPHDVRIHSITPTIKTDGRWRQRRNLDNPTLVAVEAELRAKHPHPATVSLPPPPPPMVQPGVIPPPPTASVMVPPPPPLAASVLPSNVAFRKLMDRIGGHTGEGGRLAVDVMKPIHAQFGAVGWQDYISKCAARVPELNVVLDGLLA